MSQGKECQKRKDSIESENLRQITVHAMLQYERCQRKEARMEEKVVLQLFKEHPWLRHQDIYFMTAFLERCLKVCTLALSEIE